MIKSKIIVCNVQKKRSHFRPYLQLPFHLSGFRGGAQLFKLQPPGARDISALRNKKWQNPNLTCGTSFWGRSSGRKGGDVLSSLSFGCVTAVAIQAVPSAKPNTLYAVFFFIIFLRLYVIFSPYCMPTFSNVHSFSRHDSFTFHLAMSRPELLRMHPRF